MNKLSDAFAEQKAHEEYEREKALKTADSSELIATLYNRGVSIKTIFGQYYEMEEADNARTMDVEDAVLAGAVDDGVDPKAGF